MLFTRSHAKASDDGARMDLKYSARYHATETLLIVMRVEYTPATLQNQNPKAVYFFPTTASTTAPTSSTKKRLFTEAKGPDPVARPLIKG